MSEVRKPAIAAPPIWRPEQDRASAVIAAGDVHNSLLRKGLSLWERTRGTRRMPTREELPPRVMSAMLRNIVLVRVLDEGREYQVRIMGDAVVTAHGASFQGKNTAEIDAILPGHGSVLRAIYRGVFERGEPIAFRGWYTREADGLSFFHETLVLPLGNDAVDHLLVIAVYAHSDQQPPR